MTSRKSRADDYKAGASKKNTKVGAQKKATKGRASKKSAVAGASKSSAKSSAKGSAKKNSLSAVTAWTGAPTTINQNQNLQMSQTPNGTLIFSYFNQSKTANAGKLVVSSGAGTPTTLQVPALTNQPLLLVNNWGGNNLSVSNTSTTPTPIWVVAAGPGIPGQSCKTLTSDGTPLSLGIYACATANPPPQFVNLSLVSNTSQTTPLTIFAIQVGNNVWVIALNDPNGDAGPNTQNPNTAPPAGYYATTSSNTYQGAWNWGGASVYIINLSPGTSLPAQVSLLPI